MDLDKLRELIGIFESSDLAEIEIEEEGRRVRLTKSAPQPLHAPQLIAHIPSGAPIAMPAPVEQSVADWRGDGSDGRSESVPRPG